MGRSGYKKELDNIHERLFNIANSFAGDETGYIAIALHSVCNALVEVVQSINQREMFEKAIKAEETKK